MNEVNQHLAEIKELLDKSDEELRAKLVLLTTKAQQVEITELTRKREDLSLWKQRTYEIIDDLMNRLQQLIDRLTKRKEEEGDLKHDKAEYISCIPRLNVEKLKKLLVSDLDSIDEMVNEANKAVEGQKEAMAVILAKRQTELHELIENKPQPLQFELKKTAPMTDKFE